LNGILRDSAAFEKATSNPEAPPGENFPHESRSIRCNWLRGESTNRETESTIELNHHCRAEHVDSKAVIEMAGEKTVWEGVVEVFELVGHGEAKHCYTWLSKIGPRPQVVTESELPPVRSPQSAVRAALARGKRK
jgi:hypothetical protein